MGSGGGEKGGVAGVGSAWGEGSVGEVGMALRMVEGGMRQRVARRLMAASRWMSSGRYARREASWWTTWEMPSGERRRPWDS